MSARSPPLRPAPDATPAEPEAFSELESVAWLPPWLSLPTELEPCVADVELLSWLPT